MGQETCHNGGPSVVEASIVDFWSEQLIPFAQEGPLAESYLAAEGGETGAEDR